MAGRAKITPCGTLQCLACLFHFGPGQNVPTLSARVPMIVLGGVHWSPFISLFNSQHCQPRKKERETMPTTMITTTTGRPKPTVPPLSASTGHIRRYLLVRSIPYRTKYICPQPSKFTRKILLPFHRSILHRGSGKEPRGIFGRDAGGGIVPMFMGHPAPRARPAVELCGP